MRDKLKSGIYYILNIALVAVLLIFLVSWVFHNIRANGESSTAQGDSSVESAEPSRRDVIQIEVLNGCGVNRLALRMTTFLRKQAEFDVVDFKDYERYDIPSTLVIDRTDMSAKNAKRVGRNIGVESSQIFPQISPARNTDVTVIIGADYQNLNAFK